jgi:hypothetical protein
MAEVCQEPEWAGRQNEEGGIRRSQSPLVEEFRLWRVPRLRLLFLGISSSRDPMWACAFSIQVFP